jgi:lysophospholipase L1-like esterase
MATDGDSTHSARTATVPAPPRRRGTWKRFLALGDSYTAGEGVKPERSWPAWLAQRLRVEGFAVADPQMIARTGFTCDELLVALRSALREQRVAPTYDLVTLLSGVNDQYRGLRVAQWRPVFVALLEEALRLAGDHAHRIVVISVPDWGATPFAKDRDRSAIAAAIDELNNVERLLALATGAHWVDVTDLGRDAAGDPSLLAADGLHPSASLYERWVERLLPVTRQILDE